MRKTLSYIFLALAIMFIAAPVYAQGGEAAAGRACQLSGWAGSDGVVDHRRPCGMG